MQATVQCFWTKTYFEESDRSGILTGYKHSSSSEPWAQAKNDTAVKAEQLLKIIANYYVKQLNLELYCKGANVFCVLVSQNKSEYIVARFVDICAAFKFCNCPALQKKFFIYKTCFLASVGKHTMEGSQT